MAAGVPVTTSGALLIVLVAATVASLAQEPPQSPQPSSPLSRPWLRRARFQNSTAGTVVEVPAPAVVSVGVAPRASPSSIGSITTSSTSTSTTQSPQTALQATGSNRAVRNTGYFDKGDSVFLTNTCERESMKINIETTKDFHGVIHTRDQRQKPQCSIEGRGERKFQLEISESLNPKDPNYCGAIRGHRASAQDKDTISVVLVVRVHKNIELSDDRYYLLNCTNRCRRPDCSSVNASDKLITTTELPESESSGNPSDFRSKPEGADTKECTIYDFPWAVTLLWCMAIIIVALLISQCVMCSSMVCRCVKTEVEEREDSIYEGSERGGHSKGAKQHPFRIEYDNRDVYTTSNNYEPYKLSRQDHERLDFAQDTEDDDCEPRPRSKSRKSRR